LSGPGRTASAHADLDGKEGTFHKGSERFCPGPVKRGSERHPKMTPFWVKMGHFGPLFEPFWAVSMRHMKDLGSKKGSQIWTPSGPEGVDPRPI